jgi:hypothetical protein
VHLRDLFVFDSRSDARLDPHPGPVSPFDTAACSNGLLKKDQGVAMNSAAEHRAEVVVALNFLITGI